VAEAFSRDEFELRDGVWIGCGAFQVGDEGIDKELCHKGGLQGGHGVVEVGWHC
jgi:hypothetical protein